MHGEQMDEFHFLYKVVNYQGQEFSQPIFDAQVDDWGKIKEMSW